MPPLELSNSVQSVTPSVKEVLFFILGGQPAWSCFNTAEGVCSVLLPSCPATWICGAGQLPSSFHLCHGPALPAFLICYYHQTDSCPICSLKSFLFVGGKNPDLGFYAAEGWRRRRAGCGSSLNEWRCLSKAAHKDPVRAVCYTLSMKSHTSPAPPVYKI